MARRKSKRGQRDASHIASEPLQRLLSGPAPMVSVVSDYIFRDELPEVEDRRLFHPDPERLGVSFSGGDNVVVDRSNRGSNVGRAPGTVLSFAARLGFSRPNHVAVCVRRKERREVMFASGRGGRGFRSRKRRNSFSDIGC